MEKEKLEGMLIDYIDGKLNPHDRDMVEREMATDAEALRLYEQLREVMNAMERSQKLEPGTRIKSAFDQMLQEEIRANKPVRTISWQPMVVRMAAAVALVVAGIAIGNWINTNKQREQEIADLRQQVEETKRGMLAMMKNQQSASQRIQAVNVAMRSEKADDDVVKALTKTMNEDPNTNVRLAALEALSKFKEEPGVRKILIQSLAQQKDPVVQIALIQLMVRMKEKGAVKELENIVEDEETMKAVKDEAYSGLMKLS
jgi:anti-sigma factor RsiW